MGLPEATPHESPGSEHNGEHSYPHEDDEPPKHDRTDLPHALRVANRGGFEPR